MLFRKVHQLLLPELKKKAKLLNIKRYSRLRKKILKEKIICLLCAIKIQKWYRSKKRYNDICPISLQPLKYPTWAFFPKNGKNLIYYNVRALIPFLLISGDFRDPQTREKYSLQHLQSMNKLCVSLKLKYKSLIDAYNNKEYYTKQKEREANIDAVADHIKDIVALIRDKIEDLPRTSILDFQLNLTVVYKPNLKTYIRILHSRNRKEAFITFSHLFKMINTCIINTYIQKKMKREINTFLLKEKKKYFTV